MTTFPDRMGSDGISGGAGDASSPSVSPLRAAIPIAFETMVFRFETVEARRAFFAKYFPGNPFKGELLPGVTVTAMSLSDVISAADIYEEALEAIEAGDGDASDIALQALDRVQKKLWLGVPEIAP